MHVVVLGAGYAGLTLTRRLERTLPENVVLTLVNESPDHLLQHELHRVIRRPSLADEITVSLPNVLDRAAVRIGRVESIDRDARTVQLSGGKLTYDVCAICLGAETAFYGIDGLREHATPLKRLGHARRVRADALDVIERARDRNTRGGGADPARIVVGGAGLSGVQVAGELAELVAERGGGGDVEVHVIEQYESVAPGFRPRFQTAVRNALASLDVRIRTGATVVEVDDDEITVEMGNDAFESLPYEQFVWTGGIRAGDALSGERPRVERDLRLDDRTFALGDAARVVDEAGEPAPASAQTAVRQARVAATNVTRLVEHDFADDAVRPHLLSYTYRSPGWLVSVGDDAVAQVGPAVLTGRAARAMKTTVGVGYLSSVGAYGDALGLAVESARFGRGRHQ